jgi:hypothetical protein
VSKAGNRLSLWNLIEVKLRVIKGSIEIDEIRIMNNSLYRFRVSDFCILNCIVLERIEIQYAVIIYVCLDDVLLS